MENNNTKPSYLLSVLTNKCPRCRRGNLFLINNAYALKESRYIKMNDKCPVCGQPTDLEVGFYYGTGYVSYAITVAYSVATFVAWWFLLGISIYDNSLFWWLGINSVSLLLLQPVIMRMSRSLWISWFVKYDKDWDKYEAQQPERINREQMGNW